MRRALLGILVSAMVIVENAAVASIAMVCDILRSMSYTGGVDSVAGFPPAGLSLAVFRS